MVICCIYIWLNKNNGKCYCGQTTNLEVRNSFYRRGKFSNQYFENAVKKHGWSSFKQTIIETSKENLDDLETKIIADNKYDNREYGYNILPGGKGKSHTTETRLKLSKANKGRIRSKKEVDFIAECVSKNYILVSPTGIKYVVRNRKKFGKRIGVNLDGIQRDYHCHGWRIFSGGNDVAIENDIIVLAKTMKRIEQGKHNMINYCRPKSNCNRKVVTND